MDFIAQVQAHLMSHQYESLQEGATCGNRGGFAAADWPVILSSLLT